MVRRRTIAIVGGALAGPTAAARARETDETANIVLLERADAVSYAVAGLGYHLSGEVDAIGKLNRQRAEFFRDVYDIDVRTGAEVTAIDAVNHVVSTNAASVTYDRLIFAAGVASIMPNVQGLAGARNVYAFRTLHDLRGIVAALRRGPRVIVIGGGYFGVEAADGLLRKRAKVTLVERGPELLASFAPGARGAVRAALEAAGATVHVDARIASVESKNGAVRALHFEDGRSVPCDLVVVATGVKPRTELLARAGARLRPDGSIRIDDQCRTELPDVFACGVCVAVPHAVSGRVVWLPQAAIADKTAQVAGTCAAGGHALLGPMLGSAILRAGALTVARTGATPDDTEQGDVVRAHPPSHDTFLPNATPVSIELVIDRATGTLLSADVWGASGVDKRIDVFATAIAGGLSVDALAAIDFAYAPAYATARDAVNVSATVAVQARENGLAWSADEIARRSGAVLLVDVRDARTRKEGVIAGSVAMSLADVRAKSAELAKEKRRRVVFVSADGAHGYLAARIARARGAADAGYLMGGVASWRAEGRSLVSANAAATVRAKRGKR